MSVHVFDQTQQLPISMDEAWAFFSSPRNLKEITPQHLGFEIIEPNLSPTMYAGQIISYIVKPVLGIPMKWTTEITHVEDKQYFVDEQRYGPYSMWHHKHFFKQIPNGIEMRDLIHYKVPLGFLGDVVNTFFVQREIEHIFEYRSQVLEKRFGRMK